MQRQQQQERMEKVDHDHNDNDGLEDASTQNAAHSDSEGSEFVSEQSKVNAVENQEPAGNDKYSFLIAQQAKA